MTDFVLDASVVLAILFDETGAETARRRIGAEPCFMSSVNYAEVAGRLALDGFSIEEIPDFIADVSVDVLPFDQDLALAAGHLLPATVVRGLSLGDRACLALAGALGVPALTMDRAWRDVSVGVQVEVIPR